VKAALTRIIPALTLAGIVAGGVAWAAGLHDRAGLAWAATTVLALLPLAGSVMADLFRRRLGVDIIALLAMAGALALGEYLAGAVIALMLSGGRALEAYAGDRARRELSSLLQRAPRYAHVQRAGTFETVAVEAVRQGDTILVKPGEVIPVDGVLTSPGAAVDASALTGEAGDVEHVEGDQIQSGTVNSGAPLSLRATATAEASTYAGIVRLVQSAGDSRAPFVRLADRYASYFLPLTLAVAGGAWALSGNPVRALAVLVVATPCPLILAAPMAIVSGMSRAAHRGIIVKSGGALETLARAQTLVLDKTGTLTSGRPTVASVETAAEIEPDEVLRLAASLDQASTHVFASAVVTAARDRGIRLAFPTHVVEQPGTGLEGEVDGVAVRLGKREWVAPGALPSDIRRVVRQADLEGGSSVFVSRTGRLVGAILMEDPIRSDSPRTIRGLRGVGISRVVVATGDHPDVAEMVGEAVGADRVLAERSPAEKVDAVRLERAAGVTVMVGDGINDAAALAAADVGVAMGARGATASSEAADVVLVVDRLDRIAEAIRIAQRTRRIAIESVLAGMGLSAVAMGFAAGGFLPPVLGALLQEAIDVAVILNALRALGGGRESHVRTLAPELGERFRAEHHRLAPSVERLRRVADIIDALPPTAARVALDEVGVILHDLVHHEREDDDQLYPAVARRLGGTDPTGTMSRAHQEIRHLARRFEALVRDLPAEGPAPQDLPELRRVLYSLHAILRLHMAQEDEAYLSLFEEQIPA